MLQRLQLKSTGEFDPDSLDQHFSPVPSFLCCIASADSVKISQSRTLKGKLAQLLGLTSQRIFAAMLYILEKKEIHILYLVKILLVYYSFTVFLFLGESINFIWSVPVEVRVVPPAVGL